MSTRPSLDSPERQSLIAEAAGHGISYRDLTDAHLAIALIVGRTYARVLTEADLPTTDGMAGIVVAAVAYDGDEAPEALLHGFAGLPELGDLGGLDAISQIAQILNYFSRTTCSHPEGMTMEDWRNELFDISVELQIGLG